ncbi:MAG: MFS transporter [Candidatus Dormibacteria bacterium]
MPQPRRALPSRRGRGTRTGGRGLRRLGRLAVDTSALRASRPFRRLIAGQMVSMAGRQITTVAVPYQVYLLTRSSILVGMVGLAQAVPLISVSLLGGGITDRVDRRRLLLVTQALLCSSSLALLLLALGHPAVPLIFLVVAAAACVAALDSPTRTAVVPNLVTPPQLPGALAMNMIVFQSTSIAGPALGGIIIARLGLSGAYLVDVASFSAALLAVYLLPAQPPRSARRESALASLRRGWHFTRTQPAIMGGYLMDLSAMIFGLPRAVFPVLAATTLHAGPQGLGLLYAAPGAGAVVATLLSGAVARSARLGRVVVISVVFWGLAIIAFGVSTSLWVGLACLAIAGGADSLSAVGRNTMMQTLTPDELRGRMTAAYYMVVVGGPYIGDLEAGLVAGLVSPQASVISGGVLCIAGLAGSAARFPQVWRYRQRPHEPVLPGDTSALTAPPV